MGPNMDKNHMYGLVYHPLSIIRYIYHQKT